MLWHMYPHFHLKLKYSAIFTLLSMWTWGCFARDYLVVGFRTTSATSAYHHWCCEFKSRSGNNIKSCRLSAIHFIYVKWEPHWCWLTPLPTIVQLYRGDQFYWWRTMSKPPTSRKSLIAALKGWHVYIVALCCGTCIHIFISDSSTLLYSLYFQCGSGAAVVVIVW
jgi:hypothetical protein